MGGKPKAAAKAAPTKKAPAAKKPTFAKPTRKSGEKPVQYRLRVQKARQAFNRKQRLSKGKALGGPVQGYDDRKDEQLGMTRGRDKDMSMAGRRKVARSTRKPRGSFGFRRS
jgi:hypothetical protein